MAITLNKLYPGKLDHDFLRSLLQRYTSTDGRTILGAKVGEDATIIDMGDRCLVAKTDPITFAIDHIGYYAVHVNSNDIVCMGATPKWFLATILLPEQSTRQLAEKIFSQLADACRQEKIAYCGGHTEVTIGLDRPIVVGQMLGEVQKHDVLLKENVQIGDHIILVQAAPIEATSILARAKSEILAQHFSEEFVAKCRNLLFDPGISVRRYASLALQTATVHAMHDENHRTIGSQVDRPRDIYPQRRPGPAIDFEQDFRRNRRIGPGQGKRYQQYCPPGIFHGYHSMLKRYTNRHGAGISQTELLARQCARLTQAPFFTDQ